MLLRAALVLVALLVGADDAIAQVSSTWFLAEGVSNAIFDQDILVGNPSSVPLTVTVELFPSADAQFTGTNPRTFTLPATGRLTVNLKQAFPGLNGAASAQVSAVQQGSSTAADIVVERSLFVPQDRAPYAGGSGASGARAAATRWTLAEGSGGVFETFILLTNPGGAAVTATVRYLRGNGTTITEQAVIPPAGRVTLWPTVSGVLDAEGFSTVVDATGPIVAERAMYFDDLRSGHDELGVLGPKPAWYFAEGFTGGNATIAFETFLLISNDNAQPANVAATYYLDSGAPITRTYTVAPRSRFNIWTDQERASANGPLLLPATPFSVKIESDRPVVAERALYWGTPSAADPTTPTFPWKEGHAVAGIEQPESKWAFAEGRQGPDPSGATFDSFFLVVNPNDTDIQVRATFATEDGSGVAVTVPVPANTRTNIWPVVTGSNPTLDAEFALLQGRRFSVFLESVGGSALPFVAERAMYWNGFTGGHANAGTPWTGTIATPATRPVAVTLTRMTPSSGRLSGGTVVTLEGTGFGSTAEVYFGGVRVLPTAVTGTSLTFAVPVRTAATGYGNAGPTPVALRTNGRYLPGLNFTRYLSVLAFGDSITWGVSNFIIGGQKVPVEIDRPYPLAMRDLLRSQAQFGEYVLVSNTGWPGEWATAASANSPGGDVRISRCTLGQSNCFYFQVPEPRDYLTPHDVAVVLEGVNDLNGGVTPARIRDSLRIVALDARAKGLQVMLTRFDSYSIDERTGLPAVAPAANNTLGNLVFALAEELKTLREQFYGIDMCPDGLHPNQIGYDEMGEIAFQKLRAAFPRCPAGQSTCP
jgi:lysophospholipase L1-like esterase